MNGDTGVEEVKQEADLNDNHCTDNWLDTTGDCSADLHDVLDKEHTALSYSSQMQPEVWRNFVLGWNHKFHQKGINLIQ